jgi:hypothetical protein
MFEEKRALHIGLSVRASLLLVKFQKSQLHVLFTGLLHGLA